MPIVRVVPVKPDPDIFWSSVPLLISVLKSTVCVLPASVISRLVPFNIALVLYSLAGSLSASSTPS